MGLQFAGLALLARALGPADFGFIQLVVSVFVYVAFLGDLGLSVVGARDLGRVPEVDPQIRELIGARFLLTGATTAALLVWLVLAPVRDPDRIVVLLFTAAFVVSAANVRWLLQARERFSALGAVEVIASLIQVVAIVLLVHGPGNIVGAAVALLTYPVTLTLLSVAIAGHVRSLVPRISVSGLRRIRTSAGLGVAVIATAIYYSADTVLLGALRGETEVGYYSAAYKVVLAALMVPIMASTVALPMIARIKTTHPEAVTDFLAVLSRALLVVALPLTVGTAVLAPVITETLFGEQYLPAAAPLALLMLTIVTVSANVPFSALMLSEHRDRAYLTIMLTGAAMNIVVNLVAIPRYGMLGAAVVTAMTEILVLSLILIATRRISVGIVGASLRAALPPTAAMAVVVWPLRDTLLAVPLGAAVYGLVAIATRALPIAGLLRTAGLRREERT
jgi:O-antigen/teichoic acid export membrane protein